MWYPDAQAAIVVLMNSNGNIDPGAVAGELAAELLPWERPVVKQSRAMRRRCSGPTRAPRVDVR